jgi:hypothetical protein
MIRLADTHLFSSRICLALLTLITVHGSSVRVPNFRLLVGEGLTGRYSGQEVRFADIATDVAERRFRIAFLNAREALPC